MTFLLDVCEVTSGIIQCHNEKTTIKLEPISVEQETGQVLALMSGCQGVMVSGCQGVRVSGCQGVRVSGCQGVRVSECQAVMVSGCQGGVVERGLSCQSHIWQIEYQLCQIN